MLGEEVPRTICGAGSISGQVTAEPNVADWPEPQRPPWNSEKSRRDVELKSRVNLLKVEYTSSRRVRERRWNI